MAQVEFQSLPAKEAVDFFRSKGFAIGFAWQDVWQAEHAAAFTVAKAMRIDLLEDMRDALDKAIATGVSKADFIKNLEPTLAAKGWWGKQRVLDPLNGETVLAQLGSRRRLSLIYDVNMRTAHAAGRWRRIERVARRRPWLMYKDADDDRVRPLHAAWDNRPTILRVDDPWWDTHYPPNGWRCRCVVLQFSDRDLERRGLTPSAAAPAIERRPFINKRTGEVVQVPAGIDAGFAHNVGKARLRAFTPPPLGGLPTSFPPGVELPPLPPARRRSASRILAPDLPDETYITALLRPFGATRQKPMIFTDKAGEDLVIGEEIFRNASGVLKVKKRGRERFASLLADAIKDPDEIWWVWDERRDKPGSFVLRRRYLARFTVAPGSGPGQARQAVPALVVFETGKDGWRGVTGFATERLKDLEGQRRGTLAYRRKG